MSSYVLICNHKPPRAFACTFWQAMQVWPQTRLFGTKCPKEVDCGTAAAAPVPYRKTAGKKTAIFDASVDFTNWNCW